MGTYNSAVITNGGQSMIAQSVAGASLEFTTIKTSDYTYPAGTNLAALTTINSIKQTKDITGATVNNSRVIKVSAAVDNTGLSTAYAINTIGIYAKVGSGAESLFAVVTASAADTMPAYDNKPYSYIYDVNLTMQNAANVTVTVNAAGLVNVAELNAARVEIDGEIADLKSDLFIDYTATEWKKGGLNADGGLNTSANACYSPKIYFPSQIILGANCRAVIQVYSGSTFLGKANASGGVDKNSGNWKWFTGTFSILELLNSVGGDAIRIGVYPTDSTTISSDSDAESYGQSKCLFQIPRFLTTDAFEEKIQFYQITTGQHVIPVDSILENSVFYATHNNNGDLPTAGNGFLTSLTQKDGVKMQIFYDYNYNYLSWRIGNSSNWKPWNTVFTVGLNQTIDVNNVLTNIAFYANHTNNANLPTAGNGILRTIMQTDRMGLQEFFDYSSHLYSWRLHGGNGWLQWNTKSFGGDFYYKSNIFKQELIYSDLELASLHQDIAVYNGKMFSLKRYDDNSQIRIYDLSDNSYTDYSIAYGHGNGIVFGKEVAEGSNYPLLYVSGWDDDKVYVLKFTGSAFEKTAEISLPVSGYTTCAIDDINNMMYIFSIDVYPTVVKPYLFTAWNYDTETIIHQQYTEPFETMQGIDITDGVITVASGYNTAQSGKYIRTYDLRGNKIGEYFGHPFTGTTEPEGFSIDPITKKVYMSSTSKVYEIKCV